MSGIVNYNLQKAQPVSLSTGYVEKADPFLEMLPSAINSLAKAGAQYAEDASKAAAAGRIADYEKAVANLAASAETLEMTDVQKTQALEKIQAQFADVKASERNTIDNRYTSLSVAKDTFKKREEAIVQAQIDYDKALDEDFQKRFPTWAVTMTPEERVSKAKELTFKAGLLSDMITNPDIKQTDPIFQDTLTDIEMMDIKNWLEGAKASMGGDGTVVSVANLADVQYQLTQKLAASGVDIRLASQTSDIVFAPLVKAAETYGKTAEIALKDIDKSLELNMSPGYRYISQHADMLAWVGPSVKRQFDIATADLLTNGSVADSLMYQGGLTKLDGNSFSLGFTQLSGANRNDSPLQSLATMNIGSNVEKQNANLITGITGSNLTQKSDAVANMSPADRLNAMANDRGLLEAYNVAYNAYAMSTDPDVKRAAKDHMIEKLQNSLAYATGMVKDDVKGFWTHAYQVVWEGNKVKLLDSDGNDITDDYWIAGNPQKQLKNNVQQIEEVAKNMLHLGVTQAEIDNAMNQVINESVGADGRFESVGTAEDIGAWGDKVISNAPVIKQINSAAETLGAGLRKAFSGGTIQSSEAYATSPEAGAGSSVSTTPSVGAEYSSDVAQAATETQRASDTNVLDKAGEASLELFRLAGEGAEDLGTPILEILKAAGEGVKEGGDVSEELYQQAKKELSSVLSEVTNTAISGGKKVVELTGDLLTAIKNIANSEGIEIKDTNAKTAKVSVQDLNSFNRNVLGAKEIAEREGTGKNIYVDEVSNGKVITTPYGFNLSARYLQANEKEKEMLETIAPSLKRLRGLSEEEIRKRIRENPEAFPMPDSESKALSDTARVEAIRSLSNTLDHWNEFSTELQEKLISARYQRGSGAFYGLNKESGHEDVRFVQALEEADYEKAADIVEKHSIYGKKFRKRYQGLVKALRKQAQLKKKRVEVLKP